MSFTAIVVSAILAFATFFWGVLYRDRQYDQEQKRRASVSGLPIDFDAFPEIRRPEHVNCRCSACEHRAAPPVLGLGRAYTPAWAWKLVDQGCDMTIAVGTLKAMRKERATCLRLADEIDDHVYLNLAILPVTEDVAFGY